MPIKVWLLSWNLQSEIICIQLYEFCGTITCGTELKSYFADISGALVSVRTMFLQHLISVRTISVLNQDDFTENRISNPAHTTCRTLLAAGRLWSLNHVKKSCVQLSYKKSSLWNEKDPAKCSDSKRICCCPAKWGSFCWLHRAITNSALKQERRERERGFQLEHDM